jgi:hypothetical protein
MLIENLGQSPFNPNLSITASFLDFGTMRLSLICNFTQQPDQHEQNALRSRDWLSWNDEYAGFILFQHHFARAMI